MNASSYLAAQPVAISIFKLLALIADGQAFQCQGQKSKVRHNLCGSELLYNFYSAGINMSSELAR